jgi:peptide/nickel transport system substrate-binding protein
MHRRGFLRTTAASGLAAAGVLAAPWIGRAADNKVLRFVPYANLANLDPIWTTQTGTRDASLLIWDTLYGVDDKLEPQPQMVEAHEVSPDLKTWSFRLRPNLKFHDNEPVLSRDVVASIVRWMARDSSMGRRIKAILGAVEAVDDRTFRFRLNAPFPKLTFALGKTGGPCAFIMPARIASTDPFRQISDHVGSGPMRFKNDEWVPGSSVVFERFAGYVPRAEKSNWMSGGKRINFDRIEWKTMPDSATAAAALQHGEIDWWQVAEPDLVPLLNRTPGVAVGMNNPLGTIGGLQLNHLHPPFNDVRARRALQIALNQTDYMAAAFGEDPALWRTLPSFFTPGTPLYTEQGGEPLKGARDYGLARKLLAEAGYTNEPIVLLVATDVPFHKAWGDVTNDLLKRLGMTVQYTALDWGTVGQRRAKREKPSEGGWHIFDAGSPGDECTSPAGYNRLDASGDTAWFGWPKSDAVQGKIAEWYAARDLAAEKKIIGDLNQAAMEDVVYIPLGFWKNQQAWRTNVSGIAEAPFPVFWDVSKA